MSDRLPRAVQVSLDTAGLETSFPFLIAVGPDDVIVHVGPTLRRVPHAPVVGDHAPEVLRFARHARPVTHAALVAVAPGFSIVTLRAKGMSLRGQVMLSGEVVLFLATPWVASLEELAEFGLTLYDFPPHDPIVDLLVLLQTKTMALEEAGQMTQRLDSTRGHLERALADTERIRLRLETLVTAVPWGILVEDERGCIALANPRFCEMFGVPGGPSSLPGLRCADLGVVARELFVDPDAFDANTLARLHATAPLLGETLELKDGRVFERDHVPIAGLHEQRGHLWHYRDVTAARAAEKELTRIRRQAELAAVAKDEFLSMMSHEIRTPLSAIVGLANLLTTDLSESMRRDFLRRLDSNARSLLHLVETNLDLARIESNDITLAPSPFDPWAVADEVASSLGSTALDKGLDMFVAPEGQVIGSVIGDVHRIRQVLLNLVGNAIKFTTSGHIRIAFGMDVFDDGRMAIVYSVFDTGPGIATHMHDRIFERFVRADGHDAGRGRGVGLGLAICRRLVQAMGGQVTVVSSPGAGAEFRVSLPVTAHPEAPPHPQPLAGWCVVVPDRASLTGHVLGLIAAGLGGNVVANPAEAMGRAIAFVEADGANHPDLATVERVFVVGDEAGKDTHVLLKPVTRSSVLQKLEQQPLLRRPVEAPVDAARILLVEDDDDGRDILSHMLSHLGHRVVSVADAREGLAIIAERPPDILLTDLRMPGLGGIELIRRVRAREAASGGERMPIAALSADALSSKRDEALAAGADRFVAKPVGAEELRQLVAELVDRRPRILIVDDAPDVRVLLRFLVGRDGRWRTTEAGDLASALRLVEARRYDVIVTDLGLPDVEGPVVVASLWAAGGRRTPVVVLSGRGEPAIRTACLAAGAARVLQKPVEPAVLLSTLAELMP